MHDFMLANLGPTTNHTKIQGFLDPIDGKFWLKWKRPTKNGLDILPDRAAFPMQWTSGVLWQPRLGVLALTPSN